MIHNNDRSYYIGASDTDYVMRPWDTKTFEDWWLTKLGYEKSRELHSDSIMAGTYYEHRILDSLNISGLVKDRQAVDGRLRVNLDGCTEDTIYEVKTYRLDKGFKVPLTYRRQVNVEMYAFGLRKAYIVAYGLAPEDYDNFYRDIDPERLSLYEIEYDEAFIEDYKKRLEYLSMCLDKGKFPKEEDIGVHRDKKKVA